MREGPHHIQQLYLFISNNTTEYITTLEYNKRARNMHTPRVVEVICIRARMQTM